MVDATEFSTLLAEAHDLGLHYTGTDVDELRGLIAMARAEAGAEHPVPCFGLSYDPTDRRCRICNLRNPCADADKKPRIEVAGAKLQPLPCEVCGKGHLDVELLDPETRELRDYGCSTKGCPGTISVQCGWETHAERVAREVVFEPPELLKPKAPPEATTPAGPPAAPAAAAPAPASAPASASAPAPDVPVAHLQLVPGGKADAPASAPAAPKIKIKMVPKKGRPAAPRKGGRQKKSAKPLVFWLGRKQFTSLSALVNTITESRNWSPAKFFGVDPKRVAAGDVLSKEFKGKTYTVEVKEQ